MYETGYAMNGALSQLTRGDPIANIHLSRHDGVAMVQIAASLTPDAAIEAENFLRELIAADAPKLKALQEQQMADQYAQYGSQQDARASLRAAIAGSPFAPN